MGPLDGVRIIELASIGPGPFAAMMLADMGADVLRLDRPEPHSSVVIGDPRMNVLNRGRRSVVVDLKRPGAATSVLRLVAGADALVEGYRPGVAERLGLGPDECLGANPRLVYGRVTGWGQDGPLAHTAGHDINYISLAGSLYHFGRAGEAPVPPLNLIGDFAGGGMLLAFGVVAALFEASGSGRGQVVDAAMIDGAALLMAMQYGMRAMGIWSDDRGANLLDTGAPFYDVYETADGEHVSIGSLEPQFYAELIRRLGLDDLPDRGDRENWPVIRERFRALFRSRTRAEWTETLEGTDVCFGPVLSMGEAHAHPHNIARGTFVEANGALQPAPAPRFSRTPGAISRPPPAPGDGADEALRDWGFRPGEIAKLRADGVIL
jgi:alpha-methylacyl-CoA racemase